jgi:hypothetical protein
MLDLTSYRPVINTAEFFSLDDKFFRYPYSC